MASLPRALSRGDRVAVVAPSSPIRDREALERGLARLRAWGLQPQVMPHCLATDGNYLAGSDELRAADLQRAIDDPELRAVFCARGGYGVTRLLGHLDLSGLQRDPKPIIGYSDVTALLAAAWAETGLVGFHGPMVATTESHEIGDAQIALQHSLLTDASRAPAFPALVGPDRIEVLRTGRAEGPLLGGNLTLVAALLATRWQLDLRGALLFLEDVDERPYRIDRMLTQLRYAGLDQCAGIVLGDFVGVAGQPGDRDAIHAVLAERLGDLDVPITSGWPFGHRPGSWTLPFGARARLVADSTDAEPSLVLATPSVRT